MRPVGTRMPRQGVMSVTQNDFGELQYIRNNIYEN